MSKAEHEPVSTLYAEILCRTTYDVRVPVPLGEDGLSSSEIESALSGCGFRRSDAQDGASFTLESGSTGEAEHVAIEVPFGPDVATLAPQDTIRAITHGSRYRWVALVWKGSFFQRSRYGHGSDHDTVDFPVAMTEAVVALRRAAASD